MRRTLLALLVGSGAAWAAACGADATETVLEPTRDAAAADAVPNDDARSASDAGAVTDGPADDARSDADGASETDAPHDSSRDGDATVDACATLAVPTSVGGIGVGGSNYVLWSAGDYLTTHDDPTWFGPNGVRPVVGTYHQAPQTIRTQLAAMRAAGQHKIALMIWYAPLPAGTGTAGVYGHVVDRNGGALLPQHAQNLKDLLADIVCAGFEEVQLRFATQGTADPTTWSAWDEPSYQASWNFVASTVTLTRTALTGTGVTLWTDLAVELGGVDLGQAEPFVKHLWQDYSFTFGTTLTVGASFATAPGRFTKAVALFDSTGARPAAWAFDIYDGAGSLLDTVAGEIATANDTARPIIVQESYYDDATENAEIRTHAAAKGLTVRTIMQWPNARGSGIPHFSMDYSPSYASYLVP